MQREATTSPRPSLQQPCAHPRNNTNIFRVFFFKCLDFETLSQLHIIQIKEHLCLTHKQCVTCISFFSSVCVRVHIWRASGCKLGTPGHGACNLAGGLTLVNPLLGVLRMMM